jgi:hypothetical protein
MFFYHICSVNSFSFVGQFKCICILVLWVGSVQPDTSWQHCWVGTVVTSTVIFCIYLSYINPCCHMAFIIQSVTTFYHLIPDHISSLNKLCPLNYKFIWLHPFLLLYAQTGGCWLCCWCKDAWTSLSQREGPVLLPLFAPFIYHSKYLKIELCLFHPFFLLKWVETTLHSCPGAKPEENVTGVSLIRGRWQLSE